MRIVDVTTIMIRTVFMIVAIAVSCVANAQETDIRKLMGIDQKLGSKVPDAQFTDDNGKTVQLASYFGQRPVMIVPVYYTCKSGCPVLMDDLFKTLTRAAHPTGRKKSEGQKILLLGKDFDMVMVSINPKESPEVAMEKKKFILSILEEKGIEDHLHLLTGNYENIKKVTDGLGFRWIYQPDLDVIKHPTGSVMVSNNGTISSYTIGLQFQTTPLVEAIRLASHNEVGVKADQTGMFGCLSEDPKTMHIRDTVERWLNYMCVITVIVVAGWIISLLRAGNKSTTDRGGQATGA